jgi:acyl transferase domain-containing protein
MLSPQGRCFSFDARANGFVPGEGIGVLLLKRLADAVRDGDPVRAVISGWGTNQDGRTNGITAPNPEAQARLIRGIHTRFGIDSASIDLIECHGTGTALGDPIEIEGLAAVFGEGAGPIALGSVKSNVGHLLASAGVAGAMKAMLALEAQELPPVALFEQVNPHLALAGTPFRISTELRPWVRRETPRRVGVSSFGFSGTNAHLVLEEAPMRTSTVQRGPFILPLAARTPDRLLAYAQCLLQFVEARPELDLAGLAATFQNRTQFDCRALVKFDNRATLLAGLQSIADGDAPAGGKADVSSVATSARRIRAPGYPFAAQRYWATPEKPAARARLDIAYTDRPDGLIATLTTSAPAEWLRTGTGLALALPFLVRAAVARSVGWQAVALSELVWGHVTGDNVSHVADISLTADGVDLLFDIALDGGPICHLGTASPAVLAVPAIPRLEGDGVHVEAAPRDDGIDPALLQAIARALIGHAGADQVPYAATRMWFAASLKPVLTLRAVTNADASVTVIGTDAADAPVLLLENLLMRARNELPDLMLEPVQEAAE